MYNLLLFQLCSILWHLFITTNLFYALLLFSLVNEIPYDELSTDYGGGYAEGKGNNDNNTNTNTNNNDDNNGDNSDNNSSTNGVFDVDAYLAADPYLSLDSTTSNSSVMYKPLYY